MSGVSCQLLQLDGISERRSEILSTQDQLSRYIGDISSLYSTLHNDSVRVSSEVSHGYLDIRLRELPQTSSNISRFVKVELKPSLPTLLHHIGDCHVMTLLPSNQEALVTVQLPSLSELVTVSVTVTLIYKCPEVIEALLPQDRHLFQYKVYTRTLYSSANNTHPHYTTRPLPTLLQQYINSTRPRDIGPRDSDSKPRDLYSISVHCSQTPAGLQGHVKQAAGEGEMSGLSAEQLYETVVKFRGVREKRSTTTSVTDVSLSSSLQDLSSAYHKLRGIC